MMNKLTSRKFWIALISIAAGIMGMMNFADNTIALVSSIGLTLIPTIIYIITEGRIDIASLGNIMETITDAVSESEKSDTTETDDPDTTQTDEIDTAE